MEAIAIVPVPYLHVIEDQPVQMALYQEVRSNLAYADFYAKQRAKGAYVILDNGAAEGGNPSVEELIDAYEKFTPNEVILPDVVGDKDETLIQTHLAYQRMIETGLYQRMHMMAVPQGKTFAEWTVCMREMMQLPEVTTIGISKFVTKLFAEEMSEANVRLECVDAIMSYCMQAGVEPKQIHLLGCYYSPLEIGEIEETYPGVVRSTDSAIAYVYARNNIKLTDDQRPDQKEINFAADELHGYTQLLKSNIESYYGMCNCK